MRTEVKAKLLISNDNSAQPQDIVFNSGDQSKVDSSVFNESSSKILGLDPSTVDEQVNLDNITSVAVLMMFTTAPAVSVTIVPTGAVKADCSPLKLAAGYPLVIGSDIAEIYVSNADTLASAKVRIGVAGN